MLTRHRLIKVVAAAALLAVGIAANAQTYQLQFRDVSLVGSQVTDEWNNLTAGAISGGGGFPGTTMWAPIASQTGGGDARLVKIANGPGGGPYPASGSIYYGGMSPDVNVNGGTLKVQDLTPIIGLKSLVFQISIGEANTYDFFNHEFPSLELTFVGGSKLTLEAATHSARIDQFDNGVVEMPTGLETVWINTWALQWDLSPYNDIESFDVSFTGVQHAQLYGLRLDQSDAFNVNAIPEPSMFGLITLGTVLVLWFNAWRKKKNLAGKRCVHPIAG